MENSEQISLPIIFKKKTLTYKVIIAITFLLCLISFVEFFAKSEYSSVLFWTTAFYIVASQLFLDFRSLKTKEYENIGFLHLTNNGVNLESDEVEFKRKYSEIVSISLLINETSCDPIGWGTGIVGAGIFNKNKNGIENKVSVNISDDESYIFNFFIADINTIYELDNFLKSVEYPFKLMRNQLKISSMKLFKYISFSIALIVLGFLVHSYFVDLTLSQLELKNINVMSTSIGGQFAPQVMFALTLGLIPILYAIIEKVTKVKFLNKGLIATVIIIGFGIVMWQYKIVQLNYQLQELSDFSLGFGIQNGVDIRALGTELYLATGFILGAVISGFIFKRKKSLLKEGK
jgi:hypothetical protein